MPYLCSQSDRSDNEQRSFCRDNNQNRSKATSIDQFARADSFQSRIMARFSCSKSQQQQLNSNTSDDDDQDDADDDRTKNHENPQGIGENET